ncbi:MAG: DNA-binding protein [Marmoricola sp.]|jgi:DnaK suppressor protein|nr:DNA-binding protein [Marmoricola sp.]
MAAATSKKATTPATPAVEKRAATTTATGAATSPRTDAITTPAKKASVENMTTQTSQTTPGGQATPEVPTKVAPAADLLVLEREDPWSKAELKAVRAQLLDDVERLAGELAEVEGDLAGMIENSGEGAGHDQADVGSASFERDQEMVIVHNARDMLEQSQHALERIADGTYGACEVCGQAIGKNRLMAFPRATLCLKCKQREERR